MKLSIQLSIICHWRWLARWALMTWKALPRASEAVNILVWKTLWLHWTGAQFLSSKIYFWGFLRKITERIEYPQQLSISLNLKRKLSISLFLLTSSLPFFLSAHLPLFFYFSFDLFSNDCYKCFHTTKIAQLKVYINIKYKYTNIW